MQNKRPLSVVFTACCLLSLTCVLVLSSCKDEEKKGSPSSLPETTDSQASESSSPSSDTSSLEIVDDFVKITDIDPDFMIDLRYATTNNFTHKIIYTSHNCLLRLGTAQKLKAANEEFYKMGYAIKVWDAYRPLSAQKILWSIEPDERYIANPATGSIHNRGCAVDITLVNQNGIELTMPSGFDEFSDKAHRTNATMTAVQKENMDILTKVMVQNGFQTIDDEWWHFEDLDWAQYQLSDFDPSQFK